METDNTFKAGDIIIFTKDIRGEPSRGLPLKIPAETPCVIKKLNKNHVWVLYQNQEIWLRFNPNRMIKMNNPAAKILYGISNERI